MAQKSFYTSQCRSAAFYRYKKNVLHGPRVIYRKNTFSVTSCLFLAYIRLNLRKPITCDNPYFFVSTKGMGYLRFDCNLINFCQLILLNQRYYEFIERISISLLVEWNQSFF